MAGFTKDLFKKALSWLGGKLGLVKDFAPAVSREAEDAAEARAKEASAKLLEKVANKRQAGPAATPSPAAPPAATRSFPALTSDSEARQAAQNIREIAGGLRADPSRVGEVVERSLSVFSSPSASNYVGDVTRTLASTIPQAGPSAAARLSHALKDGHKALEEQIVQRSVKGLEPGVNKLQVYHGNLGDAAILLETGAVGKSREVALTAAVRNIGDLEKVASGSGLEALTRLAKTPQIMRELEETAFKNGGNRQVFSADSVLEVAKANGAGARRSAGWRDTLTRTLDHQFAGNPRAELEWLAQHKGDVVQQIPANFLVPRVLAAAQQLPLNASNPAHDAVVNMVKGVKLTPELDKQVAKFWLDGNAALRQAGHTQAADASAMNAIGAVPKTNELARIAEAELRTGHTLATTPRPTPPPPATETVSLPDSWSAAGNRQTAFNFKPFEQTQAAKQGTQAAASDPRASLLTDNLHNTPVRPPRPD